MTKRTLTMLGTGYATATRCYNTCFTIKSDGTTLLVDAGGGNTILNRLEESGTPLDDIHYMYLTHAHTDHVLGAVWVVRMVMQMSRNGIYDGVLHVYGHDKVLGVLEWICRQIFKSDAGHQATQRSRRWLPRIRQRKCEWGQTEWTPRIL